MTLVYSDEDRVDPQTGERSAPFFKGDWSFDEMLNQAYALRLALVPTAALRAHASGLPITAAAYGALLALAADAEPAAIRHLPFVLYHRALDREDDVPSKAAAMRRVLAGRMPDVFVIEDERGAIARWPLPVPPPRVTLVVPTRDRLELLQPCIDGFLKGTDYPDLELLIVDNDSIEPETLAYLRTVARDSRVRVLQWAGPFNYSAINNFAVAQASGAIIGLMNNDLKVIGADWLDEMVRHAVRPDVGAVGARLLYGDGAIQHAGVALGIGTASHLYKGLPGDHQGHGGRLRSAHDVSAVTAACLVMRKDVWDEVDGLSTDFPVAYNDVDLCLKIRKAGYRILLEPKATLFHLESQSRGLDKGGERKERLAADRARLIERWKAFAKDDPFYSPNLGVASTRAEPAFPPRAMKPWLVPGGIGRDGAAAAPPESDPR